MKKEIFLEKLKKVQTKLAEQKMNESTFDDIIQKGKEFLQSLKDNPIDLPPLDLDKSDLTTALDTSEEDLNPSTGTLSESEDKSNKLQERSHRERILAYIQQGGSKNYNEYMQWLDTQPDGLEGKADYIKNTFGHRYNVIQRELDNEGADNSPSPIVKDKSKIEISNDLKNFLDITGAGSEVQETAVDTVNNKYDTIKLKLRNIVRGRSIKRYYILAGDAGIGKTYTVNEILEECGKLESTPVITGSIGKNPTTVAVFLWQHKDDELVVLDDCDSFLRKDANPDTINMLKGAMEPGTHYHVHITPSVQKLANNYVGEEPKEVTITDENGNESTEVEGGIPTDWNFNARLVIISNLHEAQINDALWSRCDHFDLHLTQEEFMVRLGQIINSIDVGVKDGIYEAKDVEDAKALLMSVLSPIIEAGNKGYPLYGRVIQLKPSFEFRMVKDLVDMWLSLLGRYKELHPEATPDEAKKACLKRWIRTSVIPRLSV